MECQQNTNTDFMQLIYCRDFAFKSKWKKLIKELIKSQQKSLFPALNLEALRVAANTLVPRFIPAIQKIVTNFRGQQCQFKCRTNLGCLRRLFRVAVLEDEVY
ncbi:Hypothetical_protein [Hexamita inflata]|uniref:Hypothetical_protein n=1 Tax=Hexamita inflata TaxID=28002 RepID=A0ABP1IKC6_9EUKA